MPQSNPGYGFAVAAFVLVVYDWALTFEQEVELVWPGHAWSSSDRLGDRYSWILYIVWFWTGILLFAMLCVIMITRLHAMYQRSRKILVFLIVTFLAVNVFGGVAIVITMMHTSGEELILSGTYQCSIGYAEDIPLLDAVGWILDIVWEILTLCLSVWIAAKHFRELRRHSAGGFMGDCFTVLIKTHVLYFASFVAVSCLTLILNFSPILSTYQNFLGIQTLYGFSQIFEVIQMFVLGPRLILGIREYNAKLVADSDVATAMTSIAFQERVDTPTGSGV
ncbi:uncharacterized protein EDB93DRAFT_1253135 [Suillus bovinus]|uniref:uncharacterized protein n=1 Tax=Suillus bovinus TaxID=48563 RepID=UPI001B85C39B|nr:uncharacterized protein EDB93DRAFT_1253135 [Suillus bovinus]KAG2139204.1 hypothetical protein EDB93DRAFT_1253135 [Suillus bovinus]